MGCYDTVLIPCPKCGAIYRNQTKAGECRLAEYSLHNAPVRLIGDIADDKMVCDNCGAEFTLIVKMIAAPVIAGCGDG